MYLFVYHDGGLTQQKTEPTADDYGSVDLGAIELLRTDGAGVFQQYDPDEAAWVDVATTE